MTRFDYRLISMLAGLGSLSSPQAIHPLAGASDLELAIADRANARIAHERSERDLEALSRAQSKRQRKALRLKVQP